MWCADDGFILLHLAVLQMIFDQIFTGIINAKYHFDGGSSIGIFRIFVSTLKYNNPIYTFGLKNLLDVLLRIYCDIMLVLID